MIKKTSNTQNWAHERLVPKELPWYNKQTYYDHVSRYEFAAMKVTKKKVVDIASGSGYGSQILAKSGAKYVIGVDISKEAVRYASKNYPYKNIKFKQGNAENIQINDESIDVVVSYETLEHVKNYKKFLKEVKRILKKKGTFIVSTPNKLLGSESANPFHVKELSEKEFSYELEKIFKTVEIYGQKPMHGKYLQFVSTITSKMPAGFLRWAIDTGLKIVFRGSKVKPITSFKYGFTPAFFIAVCRN